MSLHLPPDKGELLEHRDHAPVDFVYPKPSMGIGPEQVQVVTKDQINEDRDWPNILLSHNMLGIQKAMNQPLVSDVLGTDSEFRSRPGGQNTVCRSCSLSWAKGLACPRVPAKLNGGKAQHGAMQSFLTRTDILKRNHKTKNCEVVNSSFPGVCKQRLNGPSF